MSDDTRDAIKAFVKANLNQCAAEIVQWRSTGELVEGRLRELAKLCESVSSPGDSLKVAEGFVTDAALKNVVAQELESVAQTVHEYPCVVPWTHEGEPLINAVGSSEVECHANLTMLDLSDEDLNAVTFHPAVIVHKTGQA